MDQRLLRFYGEHLQRYGARDRSAHSQQERFRILADVGNLRTASVFDEGCGVGDLYPFLEERFPDVQYTGVDINPDAIAIAQEKYPAATFVCADFTEYEDGFFDYVLSSGALTFRIEDHEDVYRAHIRKMYELSRIGVAFNVLDASAITQDDEYVGYLPSELFAFCQTLTPKLTLRHDYSPEDFTLYLYH
jgi:SAM-dependent methyltransferase